MLTHQTVHQPLLDEGTGGASYATDNSAHSSPSAQNTETVQTTTHIASQYLFSLTVKEGNAFFKVIDYSDDPENFLCPISQEKIADISLKDAVHFIDGHVYNKGHLLLALKNKAVSPIDNTPVERLAKRYNIKLPKPKDNKPHNLACSELLSFSIMLSALVAFSVYLATGQNESYKPYLCGAIFGVALLSGGRYGYLRYQRAHPPQYENFQLDLESHGTNPADINEVEKRYKALMIPFDRNNYITEAELEERNALSAATPGC